MVTKVLIGITFYVAISTAAILENNFIENAKINIQDSSKFFNNGDKKNNAGTILPIRPKEEYNELDSSIINFNDTFPPISPKQGACTCGDRNVNGARIVGGTQTKNGEIPWRVLVAVFDLSKRLVSNCGGTIISPNWIMTAAHCTMDYKTGFSIDVYIGAQSNPLLFKEGQTKIEGDRIIQHPNFDRSTKKNDISLVHLKAPLIYKSNVSPACLPFGALATSDFKGATVLASGWGTTKPVPLYYENNDPVSQTLLKVSLSVLTRQECKPYLRNYLSVNEFCTYKLGFDACQGDSGSSLDYQGTNGKYYAIGIVSTGPACAQKDVAGINTKVNNFLNWIQTSTKETFCQL